MTTHDEQYMFALEEKVLRLQEELEEAKEREMRASCIRCGSFLFETTSLSAHDEDLRNKVIEECITYIEDHFKYPNTDWEIADALRDLKGA